MPTPPNSTPFDPSDSDDASAMPLEDETEENLDAADTSSEVARRIHLLGKLIIPPSSP